MTRRAIQDGADVLAVMGGDGMMHLGSTPWRYGAPVRWQPDNAQA